MQSYRADRRAPLPLEIGAVAMMRGTLVDRKTRPVTLARIKGNGAEAALEGLTRQMVRADHGPTGAA